MASKSGFSKRFNGIDYYAYSVESTKSGAQKAAGRLRKDGAKVRIASSKNFLGDVVYTVYARQIWHR